MPTLSSYLAKNYLTAFISTDHSDRPKKRRKKDKPTSAGSSLIVADDDDLLLTSRKQARRGEDEDGVPTMYEGQQKSAEFRKKKNSGWKAVSQPTDDGAGNAGRAEADKILASAAADQEQRREEIEVDDAPAIVSDNDDSAPRMGSGGKVGLQTAEDTKRLLEKEERQRHREEKEARKAQKDAPEEETIYRDATGRRIDVSLRRAEIRKQQEAAEAAKKKEREDAMGDVQRQHKEERKQELEDAKFMTLGRGADDEDMNERLKEVVRFDDPMREYMAQKQVDEGLGGAAAVEIREGAKTGAAIKSKGRVYQGHAPPNRYGILPGWRWDGVDRGNGFEKEWFQARSRSKRNEELSYQWAQDE